MKRAWCFLLIAVCAALAVSAAVVAEEEPFVPVYSARITRQSSLRSIPDESGRRLATLYRNDTVELGEIDELWTPAQRRGVVGYVLTASLMDLEVLSPYHALPDGAEIFPLAATALHPVEITGTIHGNTGALQTIPEGAVMAVGMPDANGELLLPYKRTVGRINATLMQLERVVPVGEAQPGNLVAVYSTFFSADVARSLVVGRLHNIQKGVDLLDGLVIQPGGRFSFNDICAPYTRGNGYMLGPIINYTSNKNSGYGGGICQVTTTLHIALLQLDVGIARYAPHSSRGIDYAPVGFDAAVGAGNLDYIFDNNLPFALRLRLNVCDGVVTVRLYRSEE